MPASDQRDLVLAFDVGGTSVKAGVVGPDLGILAETRRPSIPGPAILDVIEETATALLAGLAPHVRTRIGAAGIVIPGIVDAAGGRSVHSVNLDLREFAITTPMRERLGLPVALSHDVTAAGEAIQQAAPELEDPFVVIVGTGIAAVSFVHGRVVRGVSGQAGEFGHIVIRPDGPLCPCGARGCLEVFSSAAAIGRAYQQRSGLAVDGALEVVARLSTDADARAVWDEAMVCLADALTVVCTLLAPGAIVFGGGLADAGPRLVGPVTALMQERARVSAVPPVLVTSLGSRAGLYGAAHLALDLLGTSR